MTRLADRVNLGAEILGQKSGPIPAIVPDVMSIRCPAVDAADLPPRRG